MGRFVYNPLTGGESSGSAFLKLIDIGKAGKAASLDSETKLPLAQLRSTGPGGVVVRDQAGNLPGGIGGGGVTVKGPSTVAAGQSASFAITNFDSLTTYELAATLGTAALSGENVVFTAGTTGGTGGFTINGRTVALTITSSGGVTTPSINSPTADSSISSGSIAVTSTSFANSGVVDTHQSSSWQVATDNAFNTVVASIADSATNKTSWTATGLLANTTYYVRVKHTGAALGASNWSAGLRFSTTDITLAGPTTMNASQSATWTISNYDSSMTYNLSASTGTATRSGNTITYTAGASAGTGGFVVNGKVAAVTVTVASSTVNTPNITSPTNGSAVSSGSLSLTSSTFSNTGSADTHQSSTWQLASDSAFNTLVTNATGPAFKTSWTATNLPVNTTLYARVKYTGAAIGDSAWSTTVQFSTNDITLSGPSTLATNQSGNWTITNYDSAMTYNVSASTGTVTRSGNTVTYTAGTTAGSGGFTVNGKSVAVTVTIAASAPNTPNITSPSNGGSVSSGSLTLTSSSFGNTGTPDTHQSSSWQVSSDAGFSTLLVNVSNSTTNKTSVTATGLLANTSYYARVKHQGVTLGDSAWSTTVQFSTNDITLSGPSTLTTSQTGNWTITNFDSATVYTVAATVGTVSRSGNTVTYIAGTTGGTGGFTINGKTVSVTVTAVAGVINTPVIATPSNGSTVSSGTLTLTSSTFGNTGTPDTHLTSSWQIALDGGFSTIEKEALDVSGLTSQTLTGLKAGTTYFARVRHKGATLGYSAWSTGSVFMTSDITVSGPSTTYPTLSSSFTITNYNSGTVYTVTATNGTASVSGSTITFVAGNSTGAATIVVNGKVVNITVQASFVNAPTITTPTSGTTNVGLRIPYSINGNSFSTTGVSDTHQSTTWQVATDSGFGNIVQQITDITDSNYKITCATDVSYSGGVVTFPSTFKLTADTTYYIRAKVRGAALGESAWSAAVSFTTKTYFVLNAGIQSFIAPSAALNEGFGISTAISDDGSVFVTSSLRGVGTGTVSQDTYIYRRLGTTTQSGYELELEINRPIIQSADPGGFGMIYQSVAISPDGTKVYGCSPNAGGTGSSGVEIYQKAGSSWYMSGTLLFPSTSDSYNRSPDTIEISGDGLTVAVACWGLTARNINIFYNGVYQTQLQRIFNNVLDESGYTGFGNVISLNQDGTRLVTGDKGISVTGRVMTYTRSGMTWTQQPVLSADDMTPATSAAAKGYGYSVSMSSDGTMMAVTAAHNTNAGVVEGRLYIYSWNGSGWTKVTSFVKTGQATAMQLGSSVALASDKKTVYVGDIVANQVVIYGKASGGTWAEVTTITSAAAGANYFGHNIALNKDNTVAIVGAPAYFTNAGEIEIFG
jgi:hypothetical protein